MEEQTLPWHQTKRPIDKTFYPYLAGKLQSYGLYTPSVGRFIIIDYDLWTISETAKILSSKISPIVYTLNKVDTRNLTNENCLYHGINHTALEKEFGSAAVSRHKQSATLRILAENNLLELGWPSDFEDESRSTMLKFLQNYSLFTLACVRAINLTNAFRNVFPEKSYADSFYEDILPNNFRAKADLTTCKIGIDKEIKKILYYSLNIEEALEKINNCWENYSLGDPSGSRQMFYKVLNIPEPETTANVKNYNLEHTNHTAWVL